MAPDPQELSDRARDIFRLVVEHYLENGQPVGSKTLAQAGGLSLSPASIRGVMQTLEEAGLLSAPHHSAGRLPTDRGLRLFVDAMMQAAAPTAEERRAIETRIGEGGPVEALLSETTAVLSGLSACAGLVLVPRREATVRQFGLVPLSDTQALAVIVDTDGQVENRLLPRPPGLTAQAMERASNYVTERLAGLTLAEAATVMERELSASRAEIDRAAAELVAKGLAVWSRDGADRPVLIVRGQANLLDEGAVADLDRVRQLLDQLDGQAEIAQMLESAREAQATRIFIGSENSLFALSGSSVIAAPYHDAKGQVIGVVGVIGPTRLNYARIVPMVDFTAQAISRLMPRS